MKEKSLIESALVGTDTQIVDDNSEILAKIQENFTKFCYVVGFMKSKEYNPHTRSVEIAEYVWDLLNKQEKVCIGTTTSDDIDMEVKIVPKKNQIAVILSLPENFSKDYDANPYEYLGMCAKTTYQLYEVFMNEHRIIKLTEIPSNLHLQAIEYEKEFMNSFTQRYPSV